MVINIIMTFIDNKYNKWYYRIIQNARQNVRTGFVESHHIIPKSFYKQHSKTGWLPGDPNDPDNLVNLTLREHFICHLLLTKITTGKAKAKMVCAAWRIITDKKLNSWSYALIREERAKTIGLLSKGRKMPKESIRQRTLSRAGFKHSQESKDKMSASRKGKSTWNKGLTKDKDIRLNGGPPKGTPSPKKGLPGANKGKTLTRHICPYCNISTTGGNLKRWHGVNCKMK